MHCIHINVRKATFIVVSLLINNISITEMTDNRMNLTTKEQIKRQNPTGGGGNDDRITSKPIDLILHCPLNENCNKLSPSCLDCKLNTSCMYGAMVNTLCHPKLMVKCKGSREFTKSFICRFCYQTDHWEHSCELKANCNSIASPRAYYVTNCTVNNDVLCLGHRTFNKKIKCNWTGGYKWQIAMILSITLGGFGADRFYLGHWQEGIGKLFSFGGLGVWTVVDVILISLHYLGPADGSLYL